MSILNSKHVKQVFFICELVWENENDSEQK